MTTLEKIKAEIQKVLDKERDFTSENAKAQALALMWVLELIDKYAEQEPCEGSEYDKDHIWYKGHQYISLRRFLEVKAEAKKGGNQMAFSIGFRKCQKCGKMGLFDSKFCKECESYILDKYADKGQKSEFIDGLIGKCKEMLDIIDRYKYASEECDNDCEHCAYLECPKDDYQTDMDEAWKQAKLRKARKKAKRWKRKYLEMRSIVEKSAEVLDYSDKNGLHMSYPAWLIANKLGKALEPYLLERLKGGE